VGHSGWDDAVFVRSDRCSGGDCVEIASLPGGQVALRSSLTPDASPCVVTREEWCAFVEAVKAGDFDGV
jgi:hypothetical protein